MHPASGASDKPTALDWQTAHDTERFFPLEGQQGDSRTPFERDRARIIHSSAFRRLQGKSQIFTPSWAGQLRTRLTHALEVAQIARALASNAGLPGALAETAALAHDLGHPPFGHTGEEALHRCMADYGGFEGNAQTFRILTRLEPMSTRHPGLNLTRASLSSVLKYPTLNHAGARKFLYPEDALPLEGWIYAGTPHRFARNALEAAPPRSIACQMMDWADDIAYSVHDLDDGLSAGFLEPHTFGRPAFLERIFRRVRGEAAALNIGEAQVLSVVLGFSERLEPDAGLSPSPQRIHEVIASYVHHFVTATELSPGNGPLEGSLTVPLEVQQQCAILKAITQEFVLFDQRTAVFARKAHKIVRELFETLLENALGQAGERYALFPAPLRTTLERLESEAATARVVCDFIADMTDAQAFHFHERLFTTALGLPLEPL